MPNPAPKVSREEALARLAEAASPYGLRVVKTEYSELPELVLLRPAPDGREVARLRYFEPDVGQPYFRSVFPIEVSGAEGAEIERHMGERLAPVILDIFSFALWIWLADGPETQAPSS